MFTGFLKHHITIKTTFVKISTTALLNVSVPFNLHIKIEETHLSDLLTSIQRCAYQCYIPASQHWICTIHPP